jgi:hypothetical protein
LALSKLSGAGFFIAGKPDKLLLYCNAAGLGSFDFFLDADRKSVV